MDEKSERFKPIIRNLMKKIKILLLSLVFLAIGKSFGQTQYINISTGWDNTGGFIIGGLNPDPDWQVKGPSSAYVTATTRAIGGGSGCSEGIGLSTTFHSGGIYTYKVGFTPDMQGCDVSAIVSARIVFAFTDADDTLGKIKINGATPPLYNYPVPGYSVGPGIYNGSIFPQATPYNVNIPPSSIVNGLNYLEFEAFNYNYPTYPTQTYIGLNICATIEITYALPNANAGPDQTICGEGACATLNGTGRGLTYAWSNGATTASTIVCPTTTTTYTLTVTKTSTGCTSTDAVTVFVENLDPNFSTTQITGNSSYMIISATANQQTGLPSGHGYMWFVDELNSSMVPVYSVNSGDPGLGGCWWSFPTEVFDGFDGLTYTLNSSCTPANGQFKYNTNYRITRGVWSTYCGWKQSAVNIIYNKSSNGIMVVEDPDAPDMSGYANMVTADVNSEINGVSGKGLQLYPNPANDLLNIEYKLAEKVSGRIEITDLSGRKIKTVVLSEGTIQSQIDISELISGAYFVNLYESDKLTITEKMVVIK